MRPDSVRGKGLRPLSWVSLLLLIPVLAWVNWQYPVVRFAWHTLDILAFMIALALSGSAVFVALHARPRWVGWLVALTLALLALAALVFVFFSGLLLVGTIRTGEDPSFARARTAATPCCDLHVYRTNGGATTAYGAVVRQEWAFFPGLRLVRDVYSAYPAEDAAIELLSENRVRFGHATTVSLRRRVWF